MPEGSVRHFLAAIAIARSSASARLAAAQAQTGTVTGTVTGEVGQPIAGAQVALVGTGLGTATNANGKYTIVNVPAAQYRIRAQMIGHRPVENAVTVTAGATATQDFVLKRQVVALDEVVVTGTAGAARQREVGNAVAPDQRRDDRRTAGEPRSAAAGALDGNDHHAELGGGGQRLDDPPARQRQRRDEQSAAHLCRRRAASERRLPAQRARSRARTCAAATTSPAR